MSRNFFNLNIDESFSFFLNTLTYFFTLFDVMDWKVFNSRIFKFQWSVFRWSDFQSNTFNVINCREDWRKWNFNWVKSKLREGLDVKWVSRNIKKLWSWTSPIRHTPDIPPPHITESSITFQSREFKSKLWRKTPTNDPKYISLIKISRKYWLSKLYPSSKRVFGSLNIQLCCQWLQN